MKIIEILGFATTRPRTTYRTVKKKPITKDYDPRPLNQRVQDKLAQYRKTGKMSNTKTEDAAGVGIITKQNATKDVKIGDERKNVKKLGLENFDDGKNPGRKGLSQRVGIPKNATMAQLQKAAKSGGEKGRLARWQINMRRGRKKKK